MPDCVPLFEPGQDPTCVASAAVTGCRFVRVTAGVNVLNGLTQVSPTGVGLKALGVAARDKAIGEAVMVYRHGVVPVEAGEALAHGDRIASDAQGRAVKLATAGAGAVDLGVCMADGAINTFPPIALELGA